jgi:hypothetical protein
MQQKAMRDMMRRSDSMWAKSAKLSRCSSARFGDAAATVAPAIRKLEVFLHSERRRQQADEA